MPEYEDLANIFKALADPTRLSILDRLSHGPSGVMQLARPLSMSLPAVMQHLGVLEKCGLVSTQKIGRVRTCSLRPGGTKSAESWISSNKHMMEKKLESLSSSLAVQVQYQEKDSMMEDPIAPHTEVVHSSFTLTKSFSHSLEAVFAAWSEPARKKQWFTGPDEWDQEPYVLDFRVGGVEHAGGGSPDGPRFRYDAHYWDIVGHERILMTTQMRHDETLVSVSVVTVEFESTPDGATAITYTEQGAWLDGIDSVEVRRDGTEQLLSTLRIYLSELGTSPAHAKADEQ